MTPTTEQFLEHLRNNVFSNKTTNIDRLEIWDIMTALRGPDSSPNAVKSATTEVIRERILGPDHSHIVVPMSPDSDLKVKTRILMKEQYDSFNEASVFPSFPKEFTPHFYNHARAAFRQLDLKWSELNEPKETNEEKTPIR